MKRTLIILGLITGYFLFSSTSCNDEPFTQIKAVESRIFNEIKSYRLASGTDSTFVHQYVMVKEAQYYSIQMASGEQPVDTSGIQEHWDIIHDKIGGTNARTLVQATQTENAEQIVDYWREVPATDSVLLDDYTQCGVGVEYGSDGTVYVTVLMMLIE